VRVSIVKIVFIFLGLGILGFCWKLFYPENFDDQRPFPFLDTVQHLKQQRQEAAEKFVLSSIEQQLISQGLVDIQSLDSTIVADLKYATTDNFIGADMYLGLKKAYLQPEVAEKLIKAQRILKKEHPEYSLIVFDAARPLKIQQAMWDQLLMPLNEKTKYLSNPKKGSIHNYGAAVDLSIQNNNGDLLDMGTPYDFFGDLAHPAKELVMLELGLLTQEQINNRKLLRGVMKQAGFFNISTEWWHFNSCSRDKAKELYSLIE
jgi:zinc D-Ala-D-Ala dipeptidase